MFHLLLARTAFLAVFFLFLSKFLLTPAFCRNNLVTLDPSHDLRFMIQADGLIKAYLTIDNISNGNMAFKIKTTAPKFYIVKPNQSILDKGQKLIVDITLQNPKPGQPLD